MLGLFNRQEAYTWKAKLRDGNYLHEWDAKTFGKVPLECCVGVELEPKRSGLVRLSVEVDLATGQRAVFARRRCYIVDVTGNASRWQHVVTIIGWRGTTGGSYVFAFDDGRILVSSNFQAV